MRLTGCPTNEELGDWLADRASAGPLPDLEAHLSRCRECRQRMATLYRHAGEDAPPVSAPEWLKQKALEIPGGHRPAATPSVIAGRRYMVWASAAAVVLLVSLTAYRLLSDAPTASEQPFDVLRQESSISSAPQLVAPAPGGTVASDPIEFRWSEAKGATSYLLTLMNERGDILLQRPAEGESLTLDPADAPLEGGGTYFWYVTARSPDGTTLDSAIGRFSLDRR